MDSALMSVLLVKLEWCITDLRPTPWVVAMAMRSTNFIDAMNRFVGHFNHHVEELHFVKHTEWSTLLRRPVIGKQHDHGVVVETKFLD